MGESERKRKCGTSRKRVLGEEERRGKEGRGEEGRGEE